MKKLFLLLSIFATLSMQAQITLDFSTHQSADIFKVSFTNYGDKYWQQILNTDSLIIYNIEGTIFKQFRVPFSFCYPTSVLYLSDNLFNTDTLIEFLYVPCDTGIIRVINEQGIVLWTSPDITVETQNTGYTSDVPRIFKMGNDFKLTYSNSTTNHNGSRVFSLPGSVPCNQCSLETGILEPTGAINDTKMLAYPNPFNHSLTIEYALQSQKQARLQLADINGREIRSFELNNPTGKLIFDTNDLPKGIIIATLYGENQNLISKKLLKIE